VKAAPASDATSYNYGLVLKALKRPDEALEKFSQALQINSSVAETWNGRGSVFNDLKCYREAMADFDHAIAINANFADAFVNQGNTLAALKLYEEALTAYDRASALNSNLPGRVARPRQGSLFKFKRCDNALAACGRALELSTKLKLRFRLPCLDIETDRQAPKSKPTGIVEQAKFLHPANLAKASLL
jgi:protein O-GlcNAc transferase